MTWDKSQENLNESPELVKRLYPAFVRKETPILGKDLYQKPNVAGKDGDEEPNKIYVGFLALPRHESLKCLDKFALKKRRVREDVTEVFKIF